MTETHTAPSSRGSQREPSYISWQNQEICMLRRSWWVLPLHYKGIWGLQESSNNAADLGRLAVVSARPTEQTSLPPLPSPISADTTAPSILLSFFLLCCDQFGSCLDSLRPSSPSILSAHSWASYIRATAAALLVLAYRKATCPRPILL